MTTTQTKREEAISLLRDLFANRSRVAIDEIVAAGRERDLSRSTLRRAATSIGIRAIHNGPISGFWEKA